MECRKSVYASDICLGLFWVVSKSQHNTVSKLRNTGHACRSQETTFNAHDYARYIKTGQIQMKAGQIQHDLTSGSREQRSKEKDKQTNLRGFKGRIAFLPCRELHDTCKRIRQQPPTRDRHFFTQEEEEETSWPDFESHAPLVSQLARQAVVVVLHTSSQEYGPKAATRGTLVCHLRIKYPQRHHHRHHLSGFSRHEPTD